MVNISYPETRLRRNRKMRWTRDLIAEINITPHDLVLPLFIHDKAEKTAIASMPGISIHSIPTLLETIKLAYSMGITAIALFPKIDQGKKNAVGDYAFDKNNIIFRAVKQIKDTIPDIGIISDVALDPYTSHGHDGIIDDGGEVLNDQTVANLVRQACLLAEAGCDIIAPSDMMDGRIAAIRNSLEQEGHYNTQILSYAVKYASNFYGPFRDAIDSKNNLGKADKRGYQMDFRNYKEAISEAKMDIAEGADMIMVKPALAYLDIIKTLSDTFAVPIFAYQVSGEYAMLKFGAMNDVFADEMLIFYESLIAYKRAGANGIFTYAAIEITKYLND